MKNIGFKSAFAGLILFVSGWANAGLIDNVKYMEIENANGDWLQVAEVLAFDMLNADMALTGYATATAPNQWSGISGAENAIDGITLGSYGAGQIFHEGSLGSTLTITFNSVLDISSFQIIGRTDCCSNRDVYNVSFFGEKSEELNTFRSVNAGTVVPEPTTMAIFGLSLVGLAFSRKRKSV